MSSDDEFEDPYNDISSEEAVWPLEVENTAIIQATMPSGNENKPTKSICKSLTTHLNLLKGRVNELSTYLDDREDVQTIVDDEIQGCYKVLKSGGAQYNKGQAKCKYKVYFSLNFFLVFGI